jgi:hypothetical protein
MKGLNMGDWSLIARYLKQEASSSDLDQLRSLVARYPRLGGELNQLGREINTPQARDRFDFDVERAFESLHQRFELEKLI